MKKKRSQRQNRRYYLHRCIAKERVKFVAKTKTIYMPFDTTLKENLRRYVSELCNQYGYAVQLTIE